MRSKVDLRVLAFDLGTEGSAIYLHRHRDGTFSPSYIERWDYSDRPEEERYLLFQTQVDVWLASLRPDVVGYEFVQFNRGRSVIAGFRAILLADTQARDLMCHGVNVATIKKLAGVADKKKMRNRLLEQYPQLDGWIETLDDSDAAWVGIWMIKYVEVK